MSWRIVVVSQRAKLDFKLGYLEVRTPESMQRVHISEIAVLMIENTAVSLTACLLSELISKKVRVVFCDMKRFPQMELVPYAGSFDAVEKLRVQIKWTKSTKAFVWTEIVREKIRNQGKVLKRNGYDKEADMLSQYAEDIRKGDTTNREGHAAKVYFNALFSKEFSRRIDCPINGALNYGYSLLLSTICREISICGYNTQLGLFHDNTFNFYNLGCDLMEPLRPLVDWYVFGLSLKQFEQEEKRKMLGLFDVNLWVNCTAMSFLNGVRTYLRSVFHALEEKDLHMMQFCSYEL